MVATMRDVARRADVSVKTVSNVVNGYPYIRPCTKARVEAAIEELGYRLNVSARNLRARRSGIIGLAVPELSLPYFAELADAVIEEADRVGFTVLIEQTGANRRREIEALAGTRRHLTDGLIFSPLDLGPDDRALFEVDYPLVLLGERVFGAQADHVTMNNIEAACAATRHLITLGRRRIAVVGAHPGEAIGSAALRMAGYERALREAGIEVDPALVGTVGPWRRSTGDETAGRMLDAGVEVDAVFALNDAMALGVLHALHSRRIRVPEDIAVIGFDDIDDARYSIPSLSTVAPGREQIARVAVSLVVERLTPGLADQPYRQVIADSAIIGRESTGDVGPGEPERVISVHRGAVQSPADPCAARS